MQSKHAAIIASYHTESYCARQAIMYSIYRMAADTVRGGVSAGIAESFLKLPLLHQSYYVDYS